MAQTSWGFNGTINELQWARIAPLLGYEYVVETPSALAVAQSGSAKAVTVAAGLVAGKGVATELSSAETLNLNVPTSGGQWSLIVLRRVWASKTTTLIALAADTTTTAEPASVPSSYPSARLSQSGVQDDIPLYWAWCNSANTTVVLVDLRVRPDHLPRRGTAAERDAFWGPLTSLAARDNAARRGITWERSDKNWTEVYRTGPTPGWVARGGLVLVRPTSVSVGSGSAVIEADGSVSFTAASLLAILGAFTSDFDGYLIRFWAYGSVNGQGINLRLTSAGAPQSAQNYYYQGYSQSGTGGVSPFSARPATQFDVARCGVGVSNSSEGEISVIEPARAVKTRARWVAEGSDGTTDHHINAGGNYATNDVHDGFSLIDLGTALLTGYLRIYGYSKA